MSWNRQKAEPQFGQANHNRFSVLEDEMQAGSGPSSTARRRRRPRSRRALEVLSGSEETGSVQLVDGTGPSVSPVPAISASAHSNSGHLDGANDLVDATVAANSPGRIRRLYGSVRKFFGFALAAPAAPAAPAETLVIPGVTPTETPARSRKRKTSPTRDEPESSSDEAGDRPRESEPYKRRSPSPTESTESTESTECDSAEDQHEAEKTGGGGGGGSDQKVTRQVRALPVRSPRTRWELAQSQSSAKCISFSPNPGAPDNTPAKRQGQSGIPRYVAPALRKKNRSEK